MPSGELSSAARGAIDSLLNHFDPLKCFGCGAMEPSEGLGIGVRATCPGCGAALFSCNTCEINDKETGYSNLYCREGEHFKGAPLADAPA